MSLWVLTIQYRCTTHVAVQSAITQDIREEPLSMRYFSQHRLITRGAKADEIQELAKKEGCHLLRDNVSELVQQGKTSMDELIRVTYAV